MHNIFILFFASLVNFQEYIIESDDKYFNTLHIDYISINDDIYLYETIISKDCKIFLKNLNDQNKEYVLELDPEFSKFKTCNKILISNIQSIKDTLLFVTSDKVLKYYFDTVGDKFDLIEVINLEEIFKKPILYYGTKIFLEYPYLYGWNDLYNSKNSSNNLYYYKVDLNNLNIREFIELDLPKGFYWTLFQPRNIIDFTNGKFLYTNVTEYEIYIHNFSKGIIDTIKRDLPDWRSNTFSNTKFSGIHPVQIAETLQKESETNCLIHRASFVNDSTILVCYSGIENEKKGGQLYSFYYDIWKYYDNKWYIKNEHKDKFLLNSNKELSINQSYRILFNNIFSIQLNEDDEKYHVYKFNPFDY
ncbi:hypothetical protein MASR1M45_23280 [Candidatus Kapaibacterium sp.]